MAFTDRLSSLFGRDNSTIKESKSPETPVAGTQENTQKNKDYTVMAGVLKKYLGSDTEVTIPGNLGITSIGDRAFFRNANITQVKIPAGITSVGNYAFAGCENLKHVLFADSVQSIGNYAFENCKNLESFTLPDTMSSIGSYAFSGCENLVSASLPLELKSISNFMFNKCENLKNIKIPSTVTNIGWSAFSGCKSLTFLNLPERLATIGNNAFQGCAFEKITIPAYTSNIGEGAFFLCGNLASIEFSAANPSFEIIDGVLFNKNKNKLLLYPSKLDTVTEYEVPSSVSTIAYGAFSNCTSLTKIELSKSLMKIEGCAFLNCNSLLAIDIPDSVLSLGKSCFQRCSSLKDVKLSLQLSTIESATFASCESIETLQLPDSIHTIGQIAFLGCVNLTMIKIPTGTNVISKDAFSHCNRLKDISIPANLSVIERGAFSHCPFLTEYNVDSANTDFATVDGVLFDKDVTTLLAYPNGKTNDTYVIPPTVTRINDQAFMGSNNLVSITIPSNVSMIGNSAFSGCIKLTDVVIENGITSLGAFTFSKCKNLNSILLPPSVKNIDNSCFVNCDDLTFFCETSTYSYQFAMDNHIRWSSLAPEQVTDLQFVKGTHKSLTLSWKAIPGKVEYNVYIFNQSTDNFDFIGKSTTNEITLEELKPGTIYVLRVCACRDFKGKNFSGSPSEEITVSTNPDRVRNLKAQENTLNSVMLSWDNVVSATEYHIYKLNEDTNEYEDISTSKSNKVLVTGLVPGHNYQYKVMAYTTFNSLKLAGPFSDVISTGTSVGQITGLRAISVTSNSISLLWDEMNDATAYIIYELNNETGQYEELETITRNTITFSDLNPGSTFSFQVAVRRMIDRKEVTGTPCPPITVSTLLNHVTGAIMASHTESTIKLNWLKVSGASYYEVYAYNPLSDSFELAGTTQTNSIVFDSLTPNTKYKYKVLAAKEIDGKVAKGAFSSEILADTL